MGQMNMFPFDRNETGGKYRKDGPEQSLTAARNVKSGTWKALILQYLYNFYPEGATARSVSDNSLEWGKGYLSPEKAATRLQELHEQQLVEFQIDEVTRMPVQAPTTPGNTGSVHTLTRAGYNECIGLYFDDQPRVKP